MKMKTLIQLRNSLASHIKSVQIPCIAAEFKPANNCVVYLTDAQERNEIIYDPERMVFRFGDQEYDFCYVYAREA